MAAYERAMSAMITKLQDYYPVVSIYQIGGIATPGISDIDMLAVFNDEAECRDDPLRELSRDDRYMFCHGLYGASRSSFFRAQRYSFFHNYRLLCGDPLAIDSSERSPGETRDLKAQVALEYLLRWHISLAVEMTYGIARVRGFLLHAKAARIDLEFLETSSGPLWELLEKVVSWRSSWFVDEPEADSICVQMTAVFRELGEFLAEVLARRRLFVNPPREIRLARHIRLRPAEQMDWSHCGPPLPPLFHGLGRRYFNLQNRFNRFAFDIPMKGQDSAILAEYSHFNEEIGIYNKRNLPCFMPLSSSLNIH